MKVLVTGGAGFIGSHLVEALLHSGHQVCVLDNLSSGKRENINGLAIDLVVGDIRDWDAVSQAVVGYDFVFHQAALVSVPESLADPRLNHEINVTGAFHVFEAARQAGVKRVVYASSAAVYGDTPSLPARESDPPKPITPYAAAKLMNEQMASVYNQSYGMECIGLRYFNIYGPRQNASSPYSGVLSIFCQAAVQGRSCYVHGDGEQTRDFVYVADVVQANLQAMQHPYKSLAAQPVFNVGSGHQTSLNKILSLLSEIIGTKIKTTYGSARQGDIRHSLADTSHTQTSLGFTPQTSFANGLRKTADWYLPVTVAQYD